MQQPHHTIINAKATESWRETRRKKNIGSRKMIKVNRGEILILISTLIAAMIIPLN